MSKELQRKLDESLGTLLLRCRARVLELAETEEHMLDHLRIEHIDNKGVDIYVYNLPNNGGKVSVATHDVSRESTIACTFSHAGCKFDLHGEQVDASLAYGRPHFLWKLTVHNGGNPMNTSHRVAEDYSLASQLSLLLHRTHKRNIDCTLKSNISFIELLTKSMEK